MRKGKKLFLWMGLMSVTSLFVLGATDAKADDFNSSYYLNSCGGENSCSCWKWELAGDFLWWKPCIDNLNYAIVFTPEQTGTETILLNTYDNIPLSWEPGFRIMAGCVNSCCDWGLRASVTYVDIHNSDSTPRFFTDDPGEGGGAFSTLLFGIPFRFIKSSFNSSYYDWDALATYHHFLSKCNLFTPYVGISGIVFNQELKEKAIFFQEDDEIEEVIPIKWKSDYWGVGFRLGFGYEHAFSKCFKFFTRADGSLLAGKDDPNNVILTRLGGQEQGVFISKDNNDRCRVVSGYHISAGFIFDACLCDLDVLFRVGYEFLNWHNLPNPHVAQSSFGLPSPINIRTLSFHGILVGAGVKF